MGQSRRRLPLSTWIFAAAIACGVVIVGGEWAAEPRLLRPYNDTLLTGSPTVVAEGRIDRMHVSFVRDGRLYAVEDHLVFVSDDTGRTFRRIGRIPKVDPTPLEALADVVSRSGIVRILRRNVGAKNLVVLSSGTILVFYDRLYRLPVGKKVFEPVRAPENAGPFFGGVAVGPGDTVYFGEYVVAPRPHEIRVVRGTEDGMRWEVAHVFPSGQVFHVHSITHDRYRGGYWVATGDRDEEAALWYTRDGFRSLVKLGGGTQDWRAVGVLVREHDLIWGSDNDVTAAGIFRWDFGTRAPTELQVTRNPSYYAGVLSDGTLVVTTTYEPEAAYTVSGGAWPYTSIWVSRRGDRWTEVLRLRERPAMEPWGRARPQIRVPEGDGSLPLLFATPMWTDADAFSILRLRVSWAAEGGQPRE